MSEYTDHPPDRSEQGTGEQASNKEPALPPGLPADAVLAYSELVRRVRPQAIGRCVLSGLSHAQAEDLAQDALKVLWVKWPLMHAWEQYRQVLYFRRITTILLLNFIRREMRRKSAHEKVYRSRHDREVVGDEIVTTTAAEIPHQAVEDKVTLDELEHLLTHPQLKSNYRDSLRLVDEGLSTKERAESNGISEGAERVQTHRARVRAQAIKTSEEEDDQ
ncbi:RNA polymerase sigma factor [Streptomyces goshikiensis]|uniref:RNA polymerase sigma factor n=1 Tax=Streptomyces goshikiensis TaxID=1942 RepID=UPI0036AB2BE4